jgi:hypothetical protein
MILENSPPDNSAEKPTNESAVDLPHKIEQKNQRVKELVYQMENHFREKMKLVNRLAPYKIQTSLASLIFDARQGGLIHRSSFFWLSLDSPC